MKNGRIIMFGVVLIGVIAIFGVVIGTIFLNHHEEEDLPLIMDTPLVEVEDNIIKPYVVLKDRIIYTHNLNDIKYGYRELKDWFKNDDEFLEKFLKQLEFVSSYDDGGSSVYRDGGTKAFNYQDLTIIVCHTLDGNNNIHIGQNLKYTGSVCRMPVNKEGLLIKDQTYKNLNQSLGSFLTYQNVIANDVLLKDIVKEKIAEADLGRLMYSKVVVNSNNEMYAIIECDDDTLIEQINQVFNEKYNGYKFAKVKDNIYAYLLYKRGDYSLNFVTLTGTIEKVKKGELLLKTDKENYRVFHSFDLDFKVGEKIKVIFNGHINESLPPQLGATSIERIS